MRMWMVDPQTMCTKHLLGEHGEIHKHRHSFVKCHKIDGRRGQIDPAKMSMRHDELAAEIERRGYQHKSPYVQPDLSSYDLSNHGVDIIEADIELRNRCEACRARNLVYKKIIDTTG